MDIFCSLNFLKYDSIAKTKKGNNMKASQRIFFVLISAISFILSSQMINAGSINSNEAGIVSAVSGAFELDGETYQAKSSYIAEVKSFLASDEVDLTEEQAQRLIGEIRGSVGDAIASGYLIPIERTPEGSKGKDEISSETGSKSNNGLVEKPMDPENASKPNSNTNIVNENEASNTEVQEISEGEFDSEIHNSEGTISDQENMIVKDEDLSESDEASTERSSTEGTLVEESKKNDASAWAQLTSEAAKTKKEERNSFMLKVLLITVVAGSTTVTTVFIIHKTIQKTKIAASLRKIENGYIDIHTHILPKVDDGSKNMEQTIEMLKMAHSQGVRAIIATPHYDLGRRITVEKIQEITQRVREEAEKIDCNFKIYSGCEIFYEDGCVQALKEKKAMTMAGSRYVLVEFGIGEAYDRIYAGMKEMIAEGYIPIIAHIERYECLQKKRGRVAELIELGCLMQVNLKSLQGSPFQKPAASARRYIRENQVHFLASDCHNIKTRGPQIEDMLRKAKIHINENNINQMLYINPSKVIDNKYI